MSHLCRKLGNLSKDISGRFNEAIRTILCMEKLIEIWLACLTMLKATNVLAYYTDGATVKKKIVATVSCHQNRKGGKFSLTCVANWEIYQKTFWANSIEAIQTILHLQKIVLYRELMCCILGA